MSRWSVVLVVGLFVVVGAACGDDDGDGDGGAAGGANGGDSFVSDIRPAIEAIEAELGTGQMFFEVTASDQLTNLFVAVDDATAAVPYVFLDGELQPPAPKLTGASGFTFSAAAVDFDEGSILAAVSDELPESTIEALSIEGGANGAVRYVISTLSPGGGRLDITVASDGTVLEVDPV